MLWNFSFGWNCDTFWHVCQGPKREPTRFSDPNWRTLSNKGLPIGIPEWYQWHANDTQWHATFFGFPHIIHRVVRCGYNNQARVSGLEFDVWWWTGPGLKKTPNLIHGGKALTHWIIHPDQPPKLKEQPHTRWKVHRLSIKIYSSLVVKLQDSSSAIILRADTQSHSQSLDIVIKVRASVLRKQQQQLVLSVMGCPKETIWDDTQSKITDKFRVQIFWNHQCPTW